MTALADRAKREAGWPEDGGEREWPEIDKYTDELTFERDRAYAEGVEAGLRWATGAAGDPFPR